MRVHPAISALQRDPSLQRRSHCVARAALGQWASCDGLTELRRELAQYDQGDGLNALPHLRELFADHLGAVEFVRGFCATFIDALRTEPLCEVPLRHGSSTGFSRLQLLQSGGTLMTLCAYEPLAQSRTPTVAQFVDSDVVETVIAGAVDGLFHTLDSAQKGVPTITSHAARWRAGDRIDRRAGHDTRHFVHVHKTALVLQLSRTPSNPRPTFEHRVSDGALIHQISGDKRASEQVMALAVLGAMDHRAGLGAMVNFARESANDPDARWEGVRQILAMDTACGLSLLAELSNHVGDPLHAPAVATCNQLMIANPQLRRYERQAS